MSKAAIAVVGGLITFLVLACGKQDGWDSDLDSNSDSLVRLRSNKNSSLFDRGVSLKIYESSLNSIGSPKRLSREAIGFKDYSGNEIQSLILRLRESVSNQGIAADDFTPIFQIILIDVNGVVIGHWRVRENPTDPTEFALVLPTGGMYRLKNFKGFSINGFPQEEE